MKLMKRMLRVATVLGAVGASLAVGVGNSHAGLGLRIDFGNDGWDSTIQDDGVGDFVPFNLGTLTNMTASGLVTFLIDTGLSKTDVGSATNPIMDLLTGLISTGATTVKIQLSDTHFDGEPIGFGQIVSIGGTITGTSGTVTTDIYRDLSNAQFGTGTLICSTGALVIGSGDSFSGSCGNFISLDDEYSLTLETIIHLDGAGIVSYDAITRLAKDGEVDVPEPSSMLLLGFGVMGLGAWRRRRKAQQN